MRVRLYKGPMHGKSYDVRPGQYELHINVFKQPSLKNNPTVPFGPLSIRQVTYRAVKMQDAGGNICFATHPDGSTFFQYVGGK